MATSSKEIRRLWLDLEGVGRSVLSKVRDGHDGQENSAAGVNTPKSGRTTMHPSVIKLALEREGLDITSWSVRKLQPNMIDQNTLVIALLLEQELIPEHVYHSAFDVLLAPIFDPAETLNILDYTWLQIFYINWLVNYILTHDFEKLGNCRNEQGVIIPREITSFEPDFVEPEHSLEHILLPPALNSAGKIVWSLKPTRKKVFTFERIEQLNNRSRPSFESDTRTMSFGKIEELNGRSRSFFDDEWGEPSIFTRPYSMFLSK